MTNRQLVDAATAALEKGYAEARGYLDQIVDVPTARTYGLRALFDIERGSYPEAFDAMSLDCIEAYQNPTGKDSQLVDSSTGLDPVAEGHTAWVWMGGFAADTDGGYMKLDDDKLMAVMAARGGLGFTVAEHPRNSHYYMLLDEDQVATISGYTTEQRDACLHTIADRRDLLHSLDPQAVCLVVESNEDRLAWYADATLDRPICDYILLDGYPNYSDEQGGYLDDRIPNQAAWAAATGKPYGFCVSVHAYGNGSPEYPDAETFNRMMDQIDATEARDVFVYVWNDGDAPHLSDDPDMQAEVGARLAA